MVALVLQEKSGRTPDMGQTCLRGLNSGTVQTVRRILRFMDSRAAQICWQREIENRRQSMTVLIAWGSLSVGIVMGAMWRSLCEKQSSRNTNLYGDSANWHRLDLESQRWATQRGQTPDRQQRRA